MVSVVCRICSKTFQVSPCRAETAMYCCRKHAHQGQGQNRIPWARGKSKETDPRLAHISECVKEAFRRDPTRQSGEKHHFYGKTHTEATRKRLREVRSEQVMTPAMRESLKLGQTYFKGKTLADPEVAARAKKQSEATRGISRPQKSEWAKRYYAEHPEKHPNHICAQRGHETGLERTMREALTAAGISFKCQQRIGRFWVDFALPGHRLAIEVDGAYWHDATKDARRDEQIEAMGWAIVRFSEVAVTLRIAECIETVLRLLSTGNCPV